MTENKHEKLGQEELFRLLHAMQEGNLTPRETSLAVQAFGRQGFLEARSAVERLLSSQDPEVRLEALRVLTGPWHIAEHWRTAQHFLLHDPDIECRMQGAAALGYLLVNTQDRPTLNFLAHIVANRQEKRLVRESAYAAMLSILRYDPREQLHLAAKSIDLEKEVNWEVVQQYL